MAGGSAWGIVKSVGSTAFKAFTFVLKPVTVPLKFTVNFVRNHKVITAGVIGTGVVTTGHELMDKINHQGAVVELPGDFDQPDEDITTDNDSPDA